MELLDALDPFFVDDEAELFQLCLLGEVFLQVGVFDDDVQVIHLWEACSDELVCIGVERDIAVERVGELDQKLLDVKAENNV